MTSPPTALVDTFVADHLPPTRAWPDLVFTIPDVQYPELVNCGDELLDATIDQHGEDRPCLTSPTESWSYGQTRDRVNQVANVLVEELGVVPGNRVLMRGPNNPWLAACWLATMKVGAVAVTTMPLLRASELHDVVNLAEIEVALCDHRFLDDLEAVDAPLEIVAYGGSDDGDLVQRVGSHPTSFRSAPTRADDPCMIAFTSGTTGTPKGCVHGHRDVLAIADTFSRHVIKPTPDDVFTGSPPLAFTFGLGQLVIFPLRAGAATLLLEQGSPPNLAAAIDDHGATICGTAPTAYRAMLTVDDADLSSLRRAVSAGETLLRDTWEKFRDRTGVELIDGIGSTEMLHIFIGSSDDDIRPGSTGRPVPGYEARIVDDEGTEVADGTVGRLSVRGPTGCRYLDDPRQDDYVQDGWNVTGDAFLRDDDGWYWYQARIDDMIISSGYNIAGPEVEAAVMTHPAVREVAVVGEPHEERGNIVVAHVILRATDDAPPTAQDLQDHVKQEIAPYKYPRRVYFVDELPRSPTGKLQRFKLREDA